MSYDAPATNVLKKKKKKKSAQGSVHKNRAIALFSVRWTTIQLSAWLSVAPTPACVTTAPGDSRHLYGCQIYEIKSSKVAPTRRSRTSYKKTRRSLRTRWQNCLRSRTDVYFVNTHDLKMSADVFFCVTSHKRNNGWMDDIGYALRNGR